MAIQLLRKRANLSARALSLKCGLSASYVAKVESGELEPSLKTFAKIAVALNMTSQEILHIIRIEGERDD